MIEATIDRAFTQLINDFLDRLQEWRSTIVLAAKAFGVPEEEVKRALEKIDEMEEEALHFELFVI